MSDKQIIETIRQFIAYLTMRGAPIGLLIELKRVIDNWEKEESNGN